MLCPGDRLDGFFTCISAQSLVASSGHLRYHGIISTDREQVAGLVQGQYATLTCGAATLRFYLLVSMALSTKAGLAEMLRQRNRGDALGEQWCDDQAQAGHDSQPLLSGPLGLATVAEAHLHHLGQMCNCLISQHWDDSSHYHYVQGIRLHQLSHVQQMVATCRHKIAPEPGLAVKSSDPGSAAQSHS